MADERYEWLDEEAAERLLRGSAAADGVASDAADRLAAALDALRADARATGQGAAGTGTGELPGEATALAAFRTSRSAASTRRRARWRRPLRLGLVSVLAAGTLGGVAVAAGTGVLPTSFPFGHADPEPASSVSAADDLGRRDVEGTGPDEDTAKGTGPERESRPEATAGGGTADGGTPGADREPSPGPEVNGTDGSSNGTDGTGGTGGSNGTDSGNAGQGKGRDGGRDRGGGPDDPGVGPATAGTGQDRDASGRRDDSTGSSASSSSAGTGVPEGSGARGKRSGDWQRRSMRACQEYRADRLPPHLKKYLETQAEGSESINRFCDRLLAGLSPVRGPGKGGGAPGGKGQSPAAGHGRGNGNGGKNENAGEGGGGGETGKGNGNGHGHGNGRLGEAGGTRQSPARAPASTRAARQLTLTPAGTV